MHVAQSIFNGKWGCTVSMPMSGNATFWSYNRERAIKRAIKAYNKEAKLRNEIHE